QVDQARFARVFALLPTDAEEALAPARRHDGRMQGRVWLEAQGRGPVRHAVEIRHESFCCEAFIALLRRHGVVLVVADTPAWPLLMDVTADFVYCRLHGAEQLYASGYYDEALDRRPERGRAWSAGREPAGANGRDVYVYFDSDVKVHAPFNAEALAARLAAQPARQTKSA